MHHLLCSAGRRPANEKKDVSLWDHQLGGTPPNMKHFMLQEVNTSSLEIINAQVEPIPPRM